MNVFIRELKFGYKTFLLWAVVLAVFIIAGSVKYTGVESGGAEMTELFNSFPRIVLAVLGFADIDITSFAGFYGALEVYAMIIVAVYGVHLGRTAVSREQVDKTYEFLFTKPRSRTAILGQKLAAGTVFLLLIAALNLVYSIAGYAVLGLSENLTVSFVFFSLALFVFGLIFMAIAAMISALMRNSETGSLVGNLTIVVCYFIGVAYDMTDGVPVLRVFTPFKYFDPKLLLDHRIDPVFLVLAIAIIIVSCAIALWAFKKRDLAVA